MPFKRHIDLAFAIYSKNVPKLGRGKNYDENKLVKRLRFAWARLICHSGFGQVPWNVWMSCRPRVLFVGAWYRPDLQNNVAFAGIE